MYEWRFTRSTNWEQQEQQHLNLPEEVSEFAPIKFSDQCILDKDFRTDALTDASLDAGMDAGHPRDVWHLPPLQRSLAFRNWPLLIELMVNQKTVSHTLLHDACIHGAPLAILETIVAQLDPTPDWTSLDSAANNPLHSLVLCNQWTNATDQEKAITLLLTMSPAAASLHKNINGHLPLHLAAMTTQLSPTIVHALVNANPSACHIKDSGGHLALHLAAMHGNAEHVSILVDAAPRCCSVPDRRGDLPVALLARCCADQPSSLPMQTALKKLRAAYCYGLHLSDCHNKIPLDYVLSAGLKEEVVLLSPRLALDPAKQCRVRSRPMDVFLQSKFRGEDTVKNFHRLVTEYNTVPIIDTLFHSTPWTRPQHCADAPLQKISSKHPHRPKTPMKHRSFEWYSKNAAHVTGIDFEGRGRGFDKICSAPSPRLRRLAEKNRTKSGKGGGYYKNSGGEKCLLP